MSPDDKLKLLHVIVLPLLALALWMMSPSHAEKSYDRNMKWASLGLPGRWKEKEFFVAWTCRLARLWAAALALVYLVLFFILRKP
ncbi:MAG TPA: hypothetical protein VL688_09715 [Verrucomicrobiae bacterium]|jgi:hypothetical protein|nr:hypothetical protein [Verrucomicrobiae bacterium]